ncbi:MAG: hypothetical protein QM736_01200 [Vicinamibacterales bacterium]
MTRRVGSGGAMNCVAGSGFFAQSPNTFCTRPNAWSAVTSPTTARIALFGTK